MNREWKPGDIATLEINGETVRAIVDRDHCWLIFGHSFFKGIRVGNETLISDVRPLVVIDPEGPELNRLVNILGTHFRGSMVDMREAFRAMVNPPKPEEPRGFGAVVEDENGSLWTKARTQDHGSNWRQQWGGLWKPWDQLAVAKVLSEGVVV